ncbi:MAG: helix-turn-helix domain-containing protein [candidate division WOR-3 bacterium]
MINKKYYTLKQASRLLDIPIHTLKYWREEFKMKLKENSSGQKIFTQEDLDQLMMIKHLRYNEKLTLAGIKKKLAELKKNNKVNKVNKININKKDLLFLQKELIAIRNLLQQSQYDEKIDK